VLLGDVRQTLRALPECLFHCCMTSPPYWNLRSYLKADDPNKPLEIGSERTPAEFVATMVDVFRHVRRVLRDDGVLFVNLGDSYSASPGQRKSTDAHGSKQATNNGSTQTDSASVDGLDSGNQCLMPHRVAMALQADGWILRSTIIWAKKSPMPESVSGVRYKRHRIEVSADEYEAMQELREGETAGSIRGSRIPVQAVCKRCGKSISPNGSLSVGTEEIQAEREGDGNRKEKGSETGRESKTARVLTVANGPGASSELLTDNKGTDNGSEGIGEIQEYGSRSGFGESVGQKASEASAQKGIVEEVATSSLENRSGVQSAGTSPQCSMGANGEWAGVSRVEVPKTSRAETDDPCQCAAYVSGVDGSEGTCEGAMSLLPQAGGEVDDGSRHTTVEGRNAHEGKHRGRVPVLQLSQKSGPLNAVLKADGSVEIDCPGCEKCRDTGGLVLRRGKWRPTTAHEYVVHVQQERADISAMAMRCRRNRCSGTIERSARTIR
jgi:hypothetical protein